MAIKSQILFTICMLSISLILKAAPLMYVPTGEGNEMIVIDLKTNQVIKRIGELQNAHGLAAIPGKDYLIATSQDSVLTQKLKVSVKPENVSEDEHKAHHSGKEPIAPSYLSIVHPEHGHVMRRIAVVDRSHHVAVNNSGTFAVATHTNAGSVSIVDLDKMEVVKTIKTGQIPNYAAFNKSGDKVYVSNAGSGTVTVITANDWSKVDELKVGKAPEHMSFSPDGKRLYVLNVVSSTVSEIDTANGKLTKEFSVGKAPHGLDISTDNKYMFVSNKGDGTIMSINLTSAKTNIVALSPDPYHVSFSDATKKLYVSSRKIPKIWVLNATNLNVESEIDIGNGVAHQMVIQ